MSKAVLLSIKPQYCELIAKGEKMVEVRRTRPKLETPFKCYIYCTLSGSNEFFRETCNGDIAEWNRSKMAFKKGKVIGEFVCDDIYKIDKDSIGYIYKNDKEQIYFDFAETILNMRCCLTAFELSGYLGHMQGNGWCISELVIYEQPKDLSEFRKYISFLDGESTSKLEDAGMNNIRMKRPPQSWCYVEACEV